MTHLRLLSNLKIKSQRNRRRCFYQFQNETDRTVDVYWLNFAGKGVKYATLRSGHYFDVNTYDNHAWVAIDHDNGDWLLFGGSDVFVGRPSKEVYQYLVHHPHYPRNFPRFPIKITLPVNSLREICLRFLKQHLNYEHIDELEMPKSLKRDLKLFFTDRLTV